MIDINILKGALIRKKNSQLVLRSSNPSGFKLIDSRKASDKDFYNTDFLGVFTKRTRIGKLEIEVSY